MTDPDFLQEGFGPYRQYRGADGRVNIVYVGGKDIRTGRIHLPRDGGGFMIDHPVLGTVSYDGEGRRLVSPTP